jgi:metal-responsive CopG/Arc/MetJ family transcriptional regulator
MTEKKELDCVRIFDPSEKFTQQIKIAMPKNYIQEIDELAREMGVPKRIVVWDAVGNYLSKCRQR